MRRDRRQRKKLAQVARLWARGQIHQPAPDETTEESHGADNTESHASQALAVFGVFADGDVPAPKDPKKFYLWPCNVRTYALWRACQTQWRVGMQGKTGFDYAGVQVVMNRMRFRGQEGTDAFFALQAMEIAAVNVWTEEANRRATP